MPYPLEDPLEVSKHCQPAQVGWLAAALQADAMSMMVKSSMHAQAFDKGPWPRMSGRDRGYLMQRLARLMEVWPLPTCSKRVAYVEVVSRVPPSMWLSSVCVRMCSFVDVGSDSAACLALTSSTLLQENADELAVLESLDNGKPFSIARSVDVPAVRHCTSAYVHKTRGPLLPVCTRA